MTKGMKAVITFLEALALCLGAGSALRARQVHEVELDTAAVVARRKERER